MSENKKPRLVNRVPLSNAIDKELFGMLHKLTQETRIPISKLLDEAIADLLKKHGNVPPTI